MIDIDLFNQELRPYNYDYDCLEYGEYINSQRDFSDELYEQYREEKYLEDVLDD